MKKVRAFNPLTHEFEKVIQARELTDATRHAHELRCLDPNCDAQFHWVTGYNQMENTKTISPAFARNPGQAHREHCPFDYEVLAKRHREVSFIKDGKFYLRINFPLGSSYTDRFPARGRLTREQRAAAENNTGKVAVGSVAHMVDFLTKNFGSLQHDALDNLFLDYQGRSYPWPKILIGGENYRALYDVATSKQTDDSRASLIVVNPLRLTSPNERGCPRISCEHTVTQLSSRKEKIHPIIVCETDELAQAVLKAKKPLLIAARPFISSGTLRIPPWKRRDLPAYLYIRDQRQFATVEKELWRSPRYEQTEIILLPEDTGHISHYKFGA